MPGAQVGACGIILHPFSFTEPPLHKPLSNANIYITDLDLVTKHVTLHE